MFGGLEKLNTGITFLPSFYMQLISCREIFIFSKRALLQGGNWKC